MPGGEVFFFAFVAMAVLSLLGVVAFIASLVWAFGDGKGARFLYWVSLALVLLFHALELLASGPSRWLHAWFLEGGGALAFGLLSVWLVLGVPLVRWLRGGLGPIGGANLK
ncbi:MAG: hypothetical protein PVJ49_18030 [Acidobacteriota bacterium]|jgi:hypothetical protein